MQRKVRAILLIAFLLAAMLVPTGITMADGTEPVRPDIATWTEAPEREPAEICEEQLPCEKYTDREPAPQVTEESAADAQQEITEERSEQSEEDILSETDYAADENARETEEAPKAFDYAKDAAENNGFTSGYAQVLSAGADVYDSNLDDRVRTDSIVSGVVYVLERAQRGRDVLRIVYLRAEGGEPVTGWTAPGQVRPMDPETEVPEYLTETVRNEKAVCYSSFAWLTPVACRSADENDSTETTTADDTADLPTALLTADDVNLRSAPGIDNTQVITRCPIGTKLLVLDSAEMSDGVWLRVQTNENTGWLRGDFTDFTAAVNEPAEETVSEADEREETVKECTPGEPPEVRTPGEPAESADGYAAEILKWAAEIGASDEMILRARNAKSLDSLVLEDGKLVYVRTGEIVAIFDADSGILFDINSAMPVARLDIGSGMLFPLDN